MADVVYMISDMLFSSKVREAAKATGVTVLALRDAPAWAAAAREAKLAIVDLRMPTALAALEALEALAASASPSPSPSPSRSKVRTVGFIDHERTDVMDEARARGCTDVMAKGQFASALPKLLAGLSASP